MSAVQKERWKLYSFASFHLVGYALSSSLLAVINKVAITTFNYPGLLIALQYLSSSLGVLILGKLGFLRHDAFKWETAKKFLPAALVFYLAIFANTNILRHANVETFIVFRSITPLLVAVADAVFRKQPWPSFQVNICSLVIILGGAVATDSGFSVTAYSWAFFYLGMITTEMVYIKHTVTNLGLNTWGFVLVNNVLALMMSPLSWIVTREYVDTIIALRYSRGSNNNLFSPAAVSAVSLSCVFRLLISFFGFAARKAISATAFTVTGVVNKFLAVAINVAIWDKHASPVGLFCLLVTIAGGVVYQQSVAGNCSVPSQTAVAKLPKNESYAERDEENGISPADPKPPSTKIFRGKPFII